MPELTLGQGQLQLQYSSTVVAAAPAAIATSLRGLKGEFSFTLVPQQNILRTVKGTFVYVFSYLG